MFVGIYALGIVDLVPNLAILGHGLFSIDGPIETDLIVTETTTADQSRPKNAWQIAGDLQLNEQRTRFLS